ncbi:hypothetical protein LINPERPRIM_LOCUS6542 [Linum perenne]
MRKSLSISGIYSSNDNSESLIYFTFTCSLLLTYDSTAHVAKKEMSRLRSAKNSVHFIPLLVLAFVVNQEQRQWAH